MKRIYQSLLAMSVAAVCPLSAAGGAESPAEKVALFDGKTMTGEGKDREGGRIHLQSEGAEVWYRDIVLEKLR